LPVTAALPLDPKGALAGTVKAQTSQVSETCQLYWLFSASRIDETSGSKYNDCRPNLNRE